MGNRDQAPERETFRGTRCFVIYLPCEKSNLQQRNDNAKAARLFVRNFKDLGAEMVYVSTPNMILTDKVYLQDRRPPQDRVPSKYSHRGPLTPSSDEGFCGIAGEDYFKKTSVSQALSELYNSEEKNSFGTNPPKTFVVCLFSYFGKHRVPTKRIKDLQCTLCHRDLVPSQVGQVILFVQIGLRRRVIDSLENSNSLCTKGLVVVQYRRVDEFVGYVEIRSMLREVEDRLYS